MIIKETDLVFRREFFRYPPMFTQFLERTEGAYKRACDDYFDRFGKDAKSPNFHRSRITRVWAYIHIINLRDWNGVRLADYYYHELDNKLIYAEGPICDGIDLTDSLDKYRIKLVSDKKEKTASGGRKRAQE